MVIVDISGQALGIGDFDEKGARVFLPSLFFEEDPRRGPIYLHRVDHGHMV